MLSDLTIENFRGLRSFSATGLTRVNLLVGGNNAGKTSILEAAEMLLSGVPRALWRSPVRRDEYLPETEDRMSGVEVDVCHLFNGHRLEAGSRFHVEGRNDTRQTLSCELVPFAPSSTDADQQALPLTDRLDSVPSLAIRLTGSHFDKEVLLPLTPQGGLHRDLRRRFTLPEQRVAARVILSTPVSFEPGMLAALWDAIVLTPEEPRVIAALQIIEPEIDRIAALARSRNLSGILVKLRNSDARIPLGSMGDGLRYLLSVSMALVSAESGYLLVDEIDTGLHYSVMNRMWTLIIESARRLNVQVIATTHSLDCLRSLAAVCQRDDGVKGEVSLHRVARGTTDAVRYSAEELSIAIRQEMEIR